jgi:hypothetical protein
LVVQINKQVVYENQIFFEDYPSVKGHLLTDSLPSGILQFTLFNKNGLPIAERLSFVNNHEYRTAVEMSKQPLNADKRAKNNIEFSFPQPMQRSCSIAITDAGLDGQQDNKTSIYANLLLTSDLKGYIHNPAYYFSNTSDSVQEAIDLLLLTHGWSRFTWQDLKAGKFPVIQHRDQSFLTISGLLLNGADNKPADGGMLTLFIISKDSSEQSYTTTVDNNGRFSVDSLLIEGVATVYHEYKNTKGKVLPFRLTLDTPNNYALRFVAGKPVSRGNLLPAKEWEPIITQRYNLAKPNDPKVKELKEVTLVSNKKRPIEIVNEKYATGIFRGTSRTMLDLVNNPPRDYSEPISQFLRNNIPQVELQSSRFVNRKNFSLGNSNKWSVGLFLNEAPVELSTLTTINLQDVALVKFFEPGASVTGSANPGGTIAVYTKEVSNVPGKNYARFANMEYFTFNGYTVRKQFYSPDYAIPDPRHELPDNRVTLYWNPYVFTDKENGTIKLEFYNNDFTKKLRVIMEGFDVQGRLVHFERIIE